MGSNEANSPFIAGANLIVIQALATLALEQCVERDYANLRRTIELIHDKVFDVEQIND